MALAVASLCTFAPAWAHAGASADELRSTGEQLARDGRLSEAIDSFKAANKLQDRATNYCLIGLAYTRLERWPQAEVFVDECRRRASSDDPLPEWIPMLEKQLAERLANVNVAEVALEVEPTGVDVKLAISSFAPDELFQPRKIHLPPGRHVVIASARGYADAQRTIEVTDRTAQRVTITMIPRAVAQPVSQPVAMVASPHTPRASKVPLIVAGSGAALVAVGIVYHLGWFKPAADALDQATNGTMPDPALYDTWEHRFDVRRSATLALYGAGVLTLGVAAVLHFRVFKTSEHDVRVSAAPVEGGGIVNLGWTTR